MLLRPRTDGASQETDWKNETRKSDNVKGKFGKRYFAENVKKKMAHNKKVSVL